MHHTQLCVGIMPKETQWMHQPNLKLVWQISVPVFNQEKTELIIFKLKDQVKVTDRVQLQFVERIVHVTCCVRTVSQ